MNEGRKAGKKDIAVIGKSVIALAAQMHSMLEGGLVEPLNLTIRVVDANGAEAKSEYENCKDFPIGGIPDDLKDWRGE